ncbi:MAG: glycosyltransferase family 2 protein [Candidatus Aminicenantes bacterium]|nr:glycosyltransferase family 2 protein [Candidatus Aminicenantes bacterium]
MNGEEPRILVVVPFYNNGRTVASVVSEITALGWPLLVINDGSTDGGPDSLKGLPLERIDLTRNGGKGRALRLALRWARTRGYTHVVTLDADGQHSPQDIARFVEKIRRAPDCLIVGRRNFRSDVPGKSRFGRGWSNMWIRISSGGRTPDSQSGFRAYPLDPLADFKYLGAHFEFEVEILVRAVWTGVPLDWVDVSLQYFPLSGRVSHFRPFMDNFRITVMYTGLVIRNLLPFPFRRRGVRRDLPRSESPERADRPRKDGPGRETRLRYLKRALAEPTRDGESGFEKALAGWLGGFFGALPLVGIMSRTVRLYAARFGLDSRIALAVNKLGSPWVWPAIAPLAVEWGHYVRAGRFLGPADFPDIEAAFRILGREFPWRLLDYIAGGIRIGFLVGTLVFLIILAGSKPKKGALDGDHEPA